MRLTSLGWILGLANTLYAQPTFRGLGDLSGGDFSSIAHDVSADGSVVVGTSLATNNSVTAFRWEAGEMTPLSGLGVQHVGKAVSEDGSVIVGWYWNAAGESFGYRWDATGMQDLGFQDPYDVSANGSVVVGWDYPDAIRWEGGTLSVLDSLLGCGTASLAYAVTPDGSIVVGSSDEEGCAKAGTSWTGTTPTSLGYLTGGSQESATIEGVSSDGSVTVGNSIGPTGHVATVWRSGVISQLRAGNTAAGSKAFDISANGTLIVGYQNYTDGSEDDAVLWAGNSSPVVIRSYLAAHGIDMAGWHLKRAHGISADGSSIVGYGTNPAGNNEAWIVTLPPPGVPVLSHYGIATLAIGFLAVGGTMLKKRMPTAA